MKFKELLNVSAAESLKKIIAAVEKIQEKAAFATANEHELLNIKIGTALVFAVIRKQLDGKRLMDYTIDDWEDIASAVTNLAVDMDDGLYSAFVFRMYANYIDASSKILEDRISDQAMKAIRNLATELRDLSDTYQDGDILEADYVEDCLWLCFEAMMKLIAAYLGSFGGEEIAELSQAAASLSLAYGRFVLYRREEALLAAYIERQYTLDAELKKQFDDYNAEMKKQSELFSDLIHLAFNANFKEQLQASVRFAKAADVPEKHILKNTSEIDDFFLG